MNTRQIAGVVNIIMAHKVMGITKQERNKKPTLYSLHRGDAVELARNIIEKLEQPPVIPKGQSECRIVGCKNLTARKEKVCDRHYIEGYGRIMEVSEVKGAK